MKKQQLTIRMDRELYQMAKHKCAQKFGIGLSPLVKIFLRAFVAQEGVGFYVGDQDLCRLFARWLGHKRFEKFRGARMNVFPPRLKDLFELGLDKPIL